MNSDKIPGVRTNLIGTRAGFLVVTGFAERRYYKQGWINVWKCKCDCGNECERVQVQITKPSKFTSCGCRASEVQQQRPNYGFGSVNGLMTGYRIHAKNAGRPFEIPLEIFRTMTSSNCYYCGIAPYQVITNGKCKPYIYNGLDRIDSSKGYTLDNIRTCCGVCNTAKNDLTEVEFYKWIKRLIKMRKYE